MIIILHTVYIASLNAGSASHNYVISPYNNHIMKVTVLILLTEDVAITTIAIVHHLPSLHYKT